MFKAIMEKLNIISPNLDLNQEEKESFLLVGTQFKISRERLLKN